MFFLKHATEFSFLISIGVLFHSLVAETAKERPPRPSVSLLYLGQTAILHSHYPFFNFWWESRGCLVKHWEKWLGGCNDL